MAYVQAVPVRFRDIDALDHVNHAVILTYAETVRCDWFAKVLGITSMAALPFILAAAHVEYVAPIPKDAHLEVAMHVSRIGTKSWDFDYEVRSPSTRFAQVKTVQVAYDYQAKRSVPISETLRGHLESLQSPPSVKTTTKTTT